MKATAASLEATGRSATIARGATVTLVGHLAGRGLGFLVTLLLTRFLGAAEFGVFVLAMAVLQVASLFADLGLRDGALRFVARAEGRGDPADRDRVIGTVVRWSVTAGVAAAVALAMAAPLIAHTFRQPVLGWMIPALAASLPFTAMGLVLRSTLQALKQLSVIALVHNVFDPAARIVVLVVCAALGGRLAAAVASQVTAALVVSTAAALSLRRWWPPAAARLPREAARSVLAFSLPLSLTHAAGLAMQSADSLFLGYYTTAREVGIYGAAGRVAALGGMTLMAGSLAFAPHANELFARADRTGIQRLYAQVTRWLIVLGLPVYALTVVFAAPLLGLFGPEFRAGAGLLVVLATGIVVSVATGPGGDVVVMAGRSGLVFLLSLLVAAVDVGLQSMLVPRWGVVGAAVATAGTVIGSNVLNVFLGWRLVGVQPYGVALLRPLAVAAGAAVCTAIIASTFAIESLPGAALIALVWMVGYPLAMLYFALDATDGAVVRAALGRSGAPSA